MGHSSTRPSSAAIPPMSIWIFRCNFCPLVRLLITLHLFVRWAPSHLGGDVGPGTPQCSDVLPCLESVL